MKKQTINIITLILISLSGCGSSGSESHKHATVDVKYTLNGTKRPTCHNADSKGNLKPENHEMVMCLWYCGRYEGMATVNVGLTFRKTSPTDEGIWELSSEDITEANPTTCKDM